MKSYTDIEQSKKLAEILPIESADMHCFVADSLEKQKINYAIRCGTPIVKTDIPCWSLVALMSVFPKEEGSCVSISYGYYDVNGNYVSSWLCCYEKEGESTDDYIIETIPADNPVDCCYEMILKLKEKGLL